MIEKQRWPFPELLKRRGRKPRNWTAEEDALLGTLPLRIIAERLGISIPTVRKRRLVLGIKPARTGRWVDADEWLGKLSDSQVGRRFGMSRDAVYERRKKLGVVAEPQQRKHSRDDLAAMLAECGGVLGKLAERLGVSRQRVSQLLRREGLRGTRRLRVPNR